jgi:hypothetical protein
MVFDEYVEDFIIDIYMMTAKNKPVVTIDCVDRYMKMLETLHKLDIL